MLKEENIRPGRFLVFKLLVYIAFTASAILFDYRNYKAGTQMVTFYIINLLMTCFVLFKPWFETVLVTCSYMGQTTE